MPAVATRADALRLKSGGVEIVSLTALGTIGGVEIAAVGALNAPGTGRLRCRANVNTHAGLPLTLAWRAPGSSSWGMPVNIAADGDFLLEDGADPNKWVRVTVTKDYLQVGDEGRVLLGDRYGNAISSDDVSAAEAAAGDTEIFSFDVVNDSPETVRRVGAWLDPSTPGGLFGQGLNISDSGSGPWQRLTSEATALELGDLAPAGSVTLYVRRKICFGASADPKVVSWIHLRYFGPW